jgi:hypothetical protein
MMGLHTTRSIRYGPEYGNMLMIFVVGCAYAVVRHTDCAAWSKLNAFVTRATADLHNNELPW